MDMSTIALAVLAVVFGALWMVRRRARLRSDQYE
jgi:hypothetical protein